MFILQIFLITDLLFGYLRREWAMENGPKPKLPSGEDAQVILDWWNTSEVHLKLIQDPSQGKTT